MIEGELARSGVSGGVAADEPVVIRAHDLGKAYGSFSSPMARLSSALWRTGLPADSFWALRGVDLEIRRGEVIGVVGQNGAGKSTLLQLLCGTVQPSTGTLEVRGRIAALLELGAGFNPEFTGRDNLLLNGPLLGLSREQLQERMEEIIAFSGIGPFIDQPVKTYSSGMFVRLAFSLATSVDPDILVVDEALSVGDGEFARRSFDRIQGMKARGTTILFCSHSLYQIEAFCHRVLWLDHGQVRGLGSPHDVIKAYSLYLAKLSGPVLEPVGAPAQEEGGQEEGQQEGQPSPVAKADAETGPTLTPGHARVTRVETFMDGKASSRMAMESGRGQLSVVIHFESDPALPAPAAGIAFELNGVMIVSSVSSRSDGVVLARDANGRGRVRLAFDSLPLRTGQYLVGAYLASEDGVHFYSEMPRVASIDVQDTRPEPGIVDVPHQWECLPGTGS